MPAVPPNSLIAITGVSGYIASYAGLYALRAGHRVRGTVRSLARAESLKAAYEKHGIPVDDLNKRLEFVVVDDLSSEEQWTKAFENVDSVIHGALSMADLSDSQLIPDAVSAALAVLRAAKKFPSIKRVVFVSTIWTIATAPMHRDRALTTQDWNDEALRIYENNLPVDHDPILKRAFPFFPYTVAKVKAERAAWEFEFVKDTSFDLVSVLPGLTMGPMLHGELALTPGAAASGLKNDTTGAEYFPNPSITHVLAEWFVDVYGIYRKHFPKAQVPEDIEGSEPWAQELEFTESTELLGGWISLEKSVVDLGKGLGY
ncbi:hypothetical protein JB92DRAFT_3097181 [Gautieria morchelliformis]|nr:hypothetical protein JB92DRAFT_3097181 [Gautieria morchelliformis]